MPANAHRMVCLEYLRRTIPSWRWTAVRRGWGWMYRGEKAYAEVYVRAYSVLTGPSGDDCETQWRAVQGQHSEPLSSFWLRESCLAEERHAG